MQGIQRRLGARIRELRKRKGWSQEELAEVSGLHYTYIGSVERGERNLTLRSIQTIAGSLRINISELFQGIG
jgi:transcriptional regulator with XRE-family HTH domain